MITSSKFIVISSIFHVSYQQNSSDLDFFYNLECLPGYACFDTDNTKMAENSPDLSFKIKNCENTGANTILVSSSQTNSKYCLPWGLKNYNCGETDVLETDENTKYLTYDFDVVYDTRFQMRDESNNFSPIVTENEKIVIQPFKCTYKTKGNILTRDIWSYLPEASVSEIPLNGEGNFETDFFMTMDETCTVQTAEIKPTEPLYMCIIVVNIAEPDVKVVAKKIWATPSSNPDHPTNRVYFDGACHFERDALGHNIDFGSDTFASGHRKNEAQATVISLGIPEAFAGFNTMNYHLDISVCMTEAECPEKCEDALSSLGRSGMKPGSGLPGGAGQVFGRSKLPNLKENVEDLRKTNVDLPKISPFQQYRWYQRHNIPIETNATELYNYIDLRAIELRKEFKLTKQRGIFNLNHSVIINEFLNSKSRNRREIYQEIRMVNGKTSFGKSKKTTEKNARKFNRKSETINGNGELDYFVTDRLSYGPIFIEVSRVRLQRIKTVSKVLIMFGSLIIFICVAVFVKVFLIDKAGKVPVAKL